MGSPTTRTLALLRECGYTCEITEKWNQWSKTRHDLFNFIDILSLSELGIYGVQTTSGANHNARKYKIMDNPLAVKWLEAGGKILIISWTKKRKKPKNKPKKKTKGLWLWTPRFEGITYEDIRFYQQQEPREISLPSRGIDHQEPKSTTL